MTSEATPNPLAQPEEEEVPRRADGGDGDNQEKYSMHLS